ncbi:hypothetical protein VCRA2121O391_180057 [Vibrio crassostreae]|nr:hypothetical protein VCRA2113O356_200058 [Vibrio crassostreae]CAK2670996.1 hypothetical protein VCRA2121O391_180057 [Vibrio crassostreae]CAK2731905.1 hypothetical protein VCRA2133O403_180049 [Vibrio crassostreae]CAK3337058.1 hypothetical protein VCRA2120O388_210058 [Vibrio crassostreae]CAK3847454.1 hypothetical protein VCRA2133O402_200047 [Vibrio crassostreae]
MFLYPRLLELTFVVCFYKSISNRHKKFMLKTFLLESAG